MNIIDIPGVFRELFKSSTYSENIVGVGNGKKIVRGESTGKDSITILVKKKYPKSEIGQDDILPRSISGLATDVIEVGDIRLLDGRREFQRPARPGLSIGHYKISAGTFGAVVKDRTNGDLLILSNNHVLANLTDGTDGRAEVGDIILQPGMYDGGTTDKSVIGKLNRYVPLYRTVIKPKCKIARAFEGILNKCIHAIRPQYQVHVLRENEKYNLVDCAVATPLNVHDVSPDILEFGKIIGVKPPEIGMLVKKSGRSTGVTSSQIIATNVTFQVAMSGQEYGLFSEQILAGPMSMPGDSGSLILTEENYAVGLLFAGSEQATMFNNISFVLDKLNVSFT